MLKIIRKEKLKLEYIKEINTIKKETADSVRQRDADSNPEIATKIKYNTMELKKVKAEATKEDVLKIVINEETEHKIKVINEKYKEKYKNYKIALTSDLFDSNLIPKKPKISEAAKASTKKKVGFTHPIFSEFTIEPESKDDSVLSYKNKELMSPFYSRRTLLRLFYEYCPSFSSLSAREFFLELPSKSLIIWKLKQFSNLSEFTDYLHYRFNFNSKTASQISAFVSRLYNDDIFNGVLLNHMKQVVIKINSSLFNECERRINERVERYKRDPINSLELLEDDLKTKKGFLGLLYDNYVKSKEKLDKVMEEYELFEKDVKIHKYIEDQSLKKDENNMYSQTLMDILKEPSITERYKWIDRYYAAVGLLEDTEEKMMKKYEEICYVVNQFLSISKSIAMIIIK